MKSPSENQIALADNIAKTLGLEFPKGDYDFTAKAYWNFINNNIEKYNEIYADFDDQAYGLVGEYDNCDFYELGLWEF